MNRHFDPITYPPPSPARAGGAAIYDEGLRRHMLGVYRNMALGLGITALVALLVASTPALYQPIFGTPLKWVAIFAPLAFVLFFSFRVERMTTTQARTAFYAFAAVMGVSMASIFLVFTGTRDRKSTRLNSSTNAHLVCRLLLEKKKQQQSTS